MKILETLILVLIFLGTAFARDPAQVRAFRKTPWSVDEMRYIEILEVTKAELKSEFTHNRKDETFTLKVGGRVFQRYGRQQYGRRSTKLLLKELVKPEPE